MRLTNFTQPTTSFNHSRRIVMTIKPTQDTAIDDEEFCEEFETPGE
jgi:hypothetical protein